MSINFPDFPVAGQVFTAPGGPSYSWQPPVWRTLSSGVPTTTLTGEVTGVGSGTVPTVLAPGAVTNAKLALMGSTTLKGNKGTGPAIPADLTVTDVKALLGLVYMFDTVAEAQAATIPVYLDVIFIQGSPYERWTAAVRVGTVTSADGAKWYPIRTYVKTPMDFGAVGDQIANDTARNCAGLDRRSRSHANRGVWQFNQEQGPPQQRQCPLRGG